MNSRDDIVTNAAKIMKIIDFELENKINANLIQVKELQNKIEEIESKSRAKVADDLLDKKKTINGVDLICHRFNGSDVSSVKEICDNLRDKHENVILGVYFIEHEQAGVIYSRFGLGQPSATGIP